MTTKKSTKQADEVDHSQATAKAVESLPPKIIKTLDELSCELNEVEWDNKARELAEANQEVAIQEQRKKDVNKQLSSDVSTAKNRVTKLSTIVSTRREQREVTVEVKYDYELGRVIKTRTDTNEEISNREMTDQERQQQLDLMEYNNSSDTPVSSPVPTSKKTETSSPFDDDEDDDESDIRTVRNLDTMDDVALSSLADELNVDISAAIVKGDSEAIRENVKTAIRDEIEQRADLEEQDAGIDESDLE